MWSKQYPEERAAQLINLQYGWFNGSLEISKKNHKKGQATLRKRKTGVVAKQKLYKYGGG